LPALFVAKSIFAYGIEISVLLSSAVIVRVVFPRPVLAANHNGRRADSQTIDPCFAGPSFY